MKSLVFQTDAPNRYELELREQRRLVPGSNGRGLEVEMRLVLDVPRRPLASMLVEVDDGTTEIDVRAAIQAATLGDNWMLADEIARRYGLVVCLRCADDVATRPTWRLSRLARAIEDLNKIEIPAWGEVCGSCAVVMTTQALL